MEYSEKFKSAFRDQMSKTMKMFFEHKVECKIFIRNFNNWDLPLPEYLQQAKIIELDLKGQVYDFCYIEDNKIMLNMIFGEELYAKELDMFELVGIFDIDDSPVLYKPFEDLKSLEESYKVIYNIDKGIVHCLIEDTVIVI